MRITDLQTADRLAAGYPNNYFDIKSKQPFGDTLQLHTGIEALGEALGRVFSDHTSVTPFDSVNDIVFEIERGRFERLDFDLTSLYDLIATYRARGRRVVCMDFVNNDPSELFLESVVLINSNNCLEYTDDDTGAVMLEINNWILLARKKINELAQVVDTWDCSSAQLIGKRQLLAESALTMEVHLNAALSGTQAGIADAFLNREMPFESLPPNDNPFDQDDFKHASLPYELELMPDDWAPENPWMKYKSRADNRGSMQQYAHLSDQIRMVELYRNKADLLLHALEELVQS